MNNHSVPLFYRIPKQGRILLITIYFSLIGILIWAIGWSSNQDKTYSEQIPGPELIQAENPIPNYYGYPVFAIASVVRDKTISIVPNNFPPNDVYLVRMNHIGTRGIAGAVVETITTDQNGNLSKTKFPIPDYLMGTYQIAIRLESPTTGYYSYNWFYNNSFTDTDCDPNNPNCITQEDRLAQDTQSFISANQEYIQTKEEIESFIVSAHWPTEMLVNDSDVLSITVQSLNNANLSSLGSSENIGVATPMYDLSTLEFPIDEKFGNLYYLCIQPEIEYDVAVFSELDQKKCEGLRSASWIWSFSAFQTGEKRMLFPQLFVEWEPINTTGGGIQKLDREPLWSEQIEISVKENYSIRYVFDSLLPPITSFLTCFGGVLAILGTLVGIILTVIAFATKRSEN